MDESGRPASGMRLGAPHLSFDRYQCLLCFLGPLRAEVALFLFVSPFRSLFCVFFAVVFAFLSVICLGPRVFPPLLFSSLVPVVFPCCPLHSLFFFPSSRFFGFLTLFLAPPPPLPRSFVFLPPFVVAACCFFFGGGVLPCAMPACLVVLCVVLFLLVACVPLLWCALWWWWCCAPPPPPPCRRLGGLWCFSSPPRLFFLLFFLRVSVSCCALHPLVVWSNVCCVCSRAVLC